MILKIFGGLLLLVAGGYLSVTVSRFERRRLAVLDGYISLLLYIRGQIDCYAAPIEEILRRADPTLVSVCLGESRRRWENEPIGTQAGWEHPLPSLIRESRAYLEPEVERLLQAFSGELGHTSRTEQVTRCTYYIDALTEERGRLCEVLPARARTSGTLCLCTALGIAILLW